MADLIEIGAPDSLAVRTFDLLISFCGLKQTIVVKPDSSALRLQTAEGTELTGHNTICRYLATKSPAAAQLLGRSPIEQALVAEWLSFKNQYDYTGEGELEKVVALASNKANFPAAQVDRFCNLVRFMDLLQHTVDPDQIFPRITVLRPAFQPPAPVIAAAKEEKGKGPLATAEKLASQPQGTDLEAGSAKNAQQPVKVPAAGGVAPTARPAAHGDQKQPAPASTPPAKKKEKQKESNKPAKAQAADAEPSVQLLDLRVGKILKIERHPNAEALYVEQIDLGEAQPRQVVSGLVKFVPIEQMQDRLVIVVANMKPAKMRDVVSSGMVLCASNAAHDEVDPLMPPDGAVIGERITFEGFNDGGGSPEQLNPKKKVFEKIAPHLKTNADGVAHYKHVPFIATGGSVRASISDGTIS